MSTTIDFFHRQLSEFRAHMSQRAFWTNPGRHRAVTALTHVFYQLDCPDDAARSAAADALLAVIDEYKRREVLYLSHDPKPADPPPPATDGCVGC